MPNSKIEQLNQLAVMKPEELRSRWREVYRSLAPDIGPDLLRRGIAYRLQERGQGGLGPSTRREIEKLIKCLDNDGTSSAAPTLKPGTRLVRSWHGKMYQVLPLDDCFEFDGRRYNSLTQIASDITGIHWSGPRFFGLVSPTQRNGDPTLLKLVAQAFAARDHLVNGKATPLVEQYDHRHRQRLARVSWLAPDIISAILEGRQPVQLTARQLIRCSDIPLGWQDQRKFPGFASA